MLIKKKIMMKFDKMTFPFIWTVHPVGLFRIRAVGRFLGPFLLCLFFIVLVMIQRFCFPFTFFFTQILLLLLSPSPLIQVWFTRGWSYDGSLPLYYAPYRLRICAIKMRRPFVFRSCCCLWEMSWAFNFTLGRCCGKVSCDVSVRLSWFCFWKMESCTDDC